MVEVWVRLIESGKKTLEDVPISLYDKVKARLIEDGYMQED